MELIWHKEAWNEYYSWFKNDKDIFKRIMLLVDDILKHPTDGIGKPEPLKHNFAGCWSRRIDIEHRLIYQIKENQIIIIACKYHY